MTKINKFLSTERFAILACLMLTLYFFRSLIVVSGNYVPDFGDSLHNIWTWADNIHRFFDSNRSFSDSNILYPQKMTGAYQELQTANTFFFLPFLKLNAVFGYNFMLFVSFAGTAYLTYRLVLLFSVERTVALLCGLAVSFQPFRLTHLTHMQLLAFQWVILPIYFLIRYLKDGKRAHFALFCFFIYLELLGIGYLNFFCELLTAFCFLSYFLYFRKDPISFRRLRNVAVGVVVLIFAALPALLPYLRLAASGLTRDPGEVNKYGLDLIYLLVSPSNNVMYGVGDIARRDFRPDGPVSAVFPGYYGSYLACFGLAYCIVTLKRTSHWLKTFAVFSSFFFFFMMFGIKFHLHGREVGTNYLYSFLYNFVPVFRAFRYCPAYFFGLSFTVSICIGFFLSEVFEKFKFRPALRNVLPLIFSLVILREYRADIPLAGPIEHGAEIPKVYAWLENRGEGPIVELPMRCAVGYDFNYMYYSIFHKRNIANGCSGFVPASYLETQKLMPDFPSIESIARLKSIGVKFVLLNSEAKDAYQFSRTKPLMQPVYEDDQHLAFEL